MRSSNLKYLTIPDIEAAEEDETIKGARIMKSRKYKSSIFYSTKYISMDDDIYERIYVYVKAKIIPNTCESIRSDVSV